MILRRVHLLQLLILLTMAQRPSDAQTIGEAVPPAQEHLPDAATSRIDSMAKLLVQTQHQLEETQHQLTHMQAELDELRAARTSASTGPGATVPLPPPRSLPSAQQIAQEREEQEILQAEVKQHDQTKVESVSKYPVRVYGLLLFNAFSNAGVVDNVDLPSVAIPRTPGQSHGSVGGSFRQTLLGLSGTGPRVLGARTSADLAIDFFSGPTYNYYSSANGNVRLRRADIRLAWNDANGTEEARDVVHLGIDTPLISPLSPASFASVAQPELAWSGNLWTWAPQVRYSHSLELSSSGPLRTLQLEGGLLDPPVLGADDAVASRIVSRGESSRRPGFLGRVSVHGGSAGRPLGLGVGGYSDRQTFTGAQVIHMWAVTGDLQIPITHRFELDGEIYRGRGLGALGGGAYKDVLQGTDVRTGLYRTLGLNAVGGWTQLKTNFAPGIEANLIYGQDNGFASDFRQLDLTGNSYILEASARSQMAVANLIYRPKTYLILSPEYRRILNWNYRGPASTANIYTLSLGYQF